MNPLKKLASQTAVYGLSQIVGRFVNYLLVPLHTALFDTTAFGINTVLYSYVTFLNVVLTYGMETAFFRFSQKHENKAQVYSTALASIIGSSAFFMLLLVACSTPIAAAINLPQHPEYIMYFGFIIGLDAISAIPFAYLRQQNKALKFAIIKNINIFTNILLNIYFLLLCPYVKNTYGTLLPLYDGTISIGYVFIANLIASIVTLPLLGKELFAIVQAKFDAALWKQMLAYGLPLMVVGFAGMINETLDRVVISYLYPNVQAGLSATGIYGANYKLSILMTLFIQAFRYAAEPFFFNQTNEKNKTQVYAKVMNYFVVICLLLFLTVTLYLDFFKHFINQRYWEGLHVVPVLLIANMFLGIYYNLSIWYKLSDNTGKGAVISLVGAGITIAANVILVPYLGYTGSAWATLICYMSITTLCYFLGAKYFPVPYQVTRCVGYMATALIIYALLVLFPLGSQNGVAISLLKGLVIIAFAAFGYYIEKQNKPSSATN